MTPIHIKLTRVGLTNIGCFEQFETDLHPECTVLVGANGAGKTVLLEAIVAGLGAVFAEMHDLRVPMLRPEQRRALVRKDGHLATLVRPTPCEVRLGADLDGSPSEWTVTPRSPKRFEGSAASMWGRALERRVGRDESVDLPVIVYYPTRYDRLTGTIDTADDQILERLDAYTASLPASRTFRSVSVWMRRIAYASMRLTGGEVRAPAPTVHLEALASTIRRAIPEIADLGYNIASEDIFVALRDGHVQPLQQLSAGYQRVVGLVLDLAWRMVVLNPHIVSPDDLTRLTGVVIIDELDLHLHPGWQRRILRGLRAAFPGVQFIVTTHSPQVVGSAHRDQVRVLHAVGTSPATYVEGRDTNSILVDVLGDAERDPSWQGEIDAVFQAIDAERFSEARARLVRLESFWGPSDPEVVRAHTMLSLLEPA